MQRSALAVVALAVPALAVTALTPLASMPAAAQGAVPDLVGTWTGTSESIVLPAGNAHHPGKAKGPRMSEVPFTMVVEKQDGRRFYGTFSSAKHKETVIAVIGRNGTIYLVDDDGYSFATLLAPNRLELCYMKQSPTGRIASCTEMTKQ